MFLLFMFATLQVTVFFFHRFFFLLIKSRFLLITFLSSRSNLASELCLHLGPSPGSGYLTITRSDFWLIISPLFLFQLRDFRSWFWTKLDVQNWQTVDRFKGFRPRQRLGEIIEKTAKIDSLSGKKIKKMKLAHLHTVVFLNSSIFFSGSLT